MRSPRDSAPRGECDAACGLREPPCGNCNIGRGRIGGTWRDDQHLVTGSWDATIRVWDAPSLELPSALELARLLDAATTARITADRPATGKPESRGT